MTETFVASPETEPALLEGVALPDPTPETPQTEPAHIATEGARTDSVLGGAKDRTSDSAHVIVRFVRERRRGKLEEKVAFREGLVQSLGTLATTNEIDALAIEPYGFKQRRAIRKFEERAQEIQQHGKVMELIKSGEADSGIGGESSWRITRTKQREARNDARRELAGGNIDYEEYRRLIQRAALIKGYKGVWTEKSVSKKRNKAIEELTEHIKQPIRTDLRKARLDRINRRVNNESQVEAVTAAANTDDETTPVTPTSAPPTQKTQAEINIEALRKIVEGEDLRASPDATQIVEPGGETEPSADTNIEALAKNILSEAERLLAEQDPANPDNLPKADLILKLLEESLVDKDGNPLIDFDAMGEEVLEAIAKLELSAAIVAPSTSLEDLTALFTAVEAGVDDPKLYEAILSRKANVRQDYYMSGGEPAYPGADDYVGQTRHDYYKYVYTDAEGKTITERISDELAKKILDFEPTPASENESASSETEVEASNETVTLTGPELIKIEAKTLRGEIEQKARQIVDDARKAHRKAKTPDDFDTAKTWAEARKSVAADMTFALNTYPKEIRLQMLTALVELNKEAYEKRQERRGTKAVPAPAVPSAHTDKQVAPKKVQPERRTPATKKRFKTVATEDLGQELGYEAGESEPVAEPDQKPTPTKQSVSDAYQDLLKSVPNA